MRKMATIREISDIIPIEGADNIECAKIDGWSVVVDKGKYKRGDLVVYCEIDSWIPHEIAPFLSKGTALKEYRGVIGTRLRTVRLRGQISQGLVLPLTMYTSRSSGPVAVGTDVSEVLNIALYEPPVPFAWGGEAEGLFPSQRIPRTDQERVQNLVQEINEYRERALSFEITEKLEGLSCTYYLDLDGVFHVCSRSVVWRESDGNTLWKVARKHKVEQALRDYGVKGIAVQGELVGPGIQRNIYHLPECEFYVFDIYDEQSGKYLSPEDRYHLCRLLELKHVPVVEHQHVLTETVEQILALAEGQSVLAEQEREGVVFKCIEDPLIHFKAISNKYLIKSKN